MSERQLVTIEPILEIIPIVGADAIESARIRGWNVVVKKGEFTVGDRCVYFEIDSFLPTTDPRFSFLATRGTKTFNEKVGHVLRTARLRGTISQGLAIGLEAFPEIVDDTEDIAALLGVVKYEAPIPAQLAGQIAGSFPSQFASKTDAERIQNLIEVYQTLRNACTWVPTEKIDGSSVTYINDEGTLRVCTRNWELSPNSDTTQWKVATKLDILGALESGDAVQGELYGEGIQGNPLRVKGHHFAVFAFWRNRMLVPREGWPELFVTTSAPTYDVTLPDTVEELIALTDGIKSLISPDRLAEGIVWHSSDGTTFDELDGRGCFKSISNTFLVKQAS